MSSDTLTIDADRPRPPGASEQHRAWLAGDRGLSRLALITLALTWFETSFGAFTRGSGSGYGCRDHWPLCDGGVLSVGDLGGVLPRLQFEMIVEWTHRWIAAMVVVGVVTLAVRCRHRPGALRVLTGAGIGIVIAQSLLGAAVVLDFGNGDLVTLHLLGATALLGVLTHLVVVTGDRGTDRPVADRRWVALHLLVAIGTFATLILGSLVHDLFIPGWPLVGNKLVPPLGNTWKLDFHILHRVVAGAMWLVAGGVTWLARQRQRPVEERRLLLTTTALFTVNIGLGGLHVITQVSSAVAIVAHLAVSAAAWVTSYAALARSATRGAAPSAPAAGHARATSPRAGRQVARR